MRSPFSSLLRGLWTGLRARRPVLFENSLSICFESGSFFRTAFVILKSQLGSLCCDQPIWLSPFRVMRLSADGAGQPLLRKNAFLSEKRAKALLNAPFGKNFSPDWTGRLLFAAGSSDTAAGLALLFTVMRLPISLLRELLPRAVDRGFSAAAHLLGFLPLWAALTAFLAAAGWAAAVLGGLLRMRSFSLSQNEDTAVIRRGLPFRSVRVVFLRRAVLVTRQHVLLRPSGRISLWAQAGGKNAVLLKPCFVPSPEEGLAAPQALRPRRGVWVRFCLPGLLGAAASAFLFGTAGLLGAWTAAARLLSVVGFCFASLRFVSGRAAMKSAGAEKTGTLLVLTVSQRHTVVTARIPFCCITRAVLRQSPWQRLSGSCDLFVRAYGKERFHLPGLSADAARRFLDSLNL